MTTFDPRTGDRHPSVSPELMRWRGRSGWDRHPGVRSGSRLSVAERAADVVCRGAGSWVCQALLLASVAVIVLVATRDSTAGGVALLDLGLSAVAVVEVGVVVLAAARAERITADAALYDLDQARRATAVAEDLRLEVQRLHADLARIAAQTERSAHPARPGAPATGADRALPTASFAPAEPTPHRHR